MSRKFLCLLLALICVISLNLTGCRKPVDATESTGGALAATQTTTDATESTSETKTDGTTNTTDSTDVPSDGIAWDDDNTLKILAIGNSFSEDCMEYVYQIAKAAGVENIKLGNLYIGGCSLLTHLSNAQADKNAYTYYTNDSGKWVTHKNYKMSSAIKSENWDFISFQQASTNSGMANTYDTLNQLLPMVEGLCTNKNVEFIWHMTWAYQADSTHKGFKNYNNDQMQMYNAIVNAVKTCIVPNEKITRVVPNGTAIQNARTSYLGDTLTRDGYHMSLDKGRLLTGITMVASTVGIEWDSIDLSSVCEDQFFRKAAIESVKNAMETPFAVTTSAVKNPVETIDLSKYELKPLTLHKNQYWYSIMETTLTGQAGTMEKYFATQKFTKEDLPVGSIIVLADGWKYRPEAWKGDALNTSSQRPGEVYTKVVAVTEEWWGEWTSRGFNIAKKNGSVLTEYTPEQISEVFKIYVPKG